MAAERCLCWFQVPATCCAFAEVGRKHAGKQGRPAWGMGAGRSVSTRGSPPQMPIDLPRWRFGASTKSSMCGGYCARIYRDKGLSSARGPMFERVIGLGLIWGAHLLAICARGNLRRGSPSDLVGHRQECVIGGGPALGVRLRAAISKRRGKPIEARQWRKLSTSRDSSCQRRARCWGEVLRRGVRPALPSRTCSAQCGRNARAVIGR